MGASPRGAPGCPELADWTMSMDNVLIVLMHFQSSSVNLMGIMDQWDRIMLIER